MGSTARLTLALCLLLPACGDRGSEPDGTADAKTDAKTDAPPAREADPKADAPGTDGPVHRRMLEWVDPNAANLLFTRLPSNTDAAALASVFALPSSLEKMLRQALYIGEDLDAVAALDAPPSAEWLGPEVVAFLPSIGNDNYVLRRTTRSKDEVIKLLTGAGLEPTEVEGMDVYAPRGPFPWKVVFLEDDLLGFIPVRTLGVGLGPFTAGRDLPPSQTETEMTKTLDAEPTALLEMFAAGPLLHLDLRQDVAGIRLALRTWKEGMDGAVVIQPVKDADAAVEALGKRDLSFETDAVQAIAGRVAFTVSGPMIEGRLQMTADDLANVKKGS